MGLNINGTDTTSVLFNNQSVNKVTYNGNVVWCRRFSISVSVGQNVESYSIVRTSTEVLPKPQSGISNGDTIYYGDVLRVDARPMNGYQMDRTYPYNITVTGTTTVSVTASALTITLIAPEVTVYWEEDEFGGYVLSIWVKNPNLHIVDVIYRIYDQVGNNFVYQTYTNLKALEEVCIYSDTITDSSIIGGTVSVWLKRTDASNTPLTNVDFGEAIETTTTVE